MDNSFKIITLIFIVIAALIIYISWLASSSKRLLADIMAQYDLSLCEIYYNTTHAYINAPDGKKFMFAHNSSTLPIIKKHHPL